MSEPINLEARRAIAKNDSAEWTPQSVIETVLHRLKNNEDVADGAIIILTSRSADGRVVPGTTYTARLTVLEMFGLLDITKLALLQQQE